MQNCLTYVFRIFDFKKDFMKNIVKLVSVKDSNLSELTKIHLHQKTIERIHQKSIRAEQARARRHGGVYLKQS
jgi:hypothetical protein